MEFIGLFYAVVLTLGFLIIAGFCVIYIIMGLRQMSLGSSEKSEIKKKAGFKTLLIASSILLVFLILFIVLLSGGN